MIQLFLEDSCLLCNDVMLHAVPDVLKMKAVWSFWNNGNYRPGDTVSCPI